MKRTILLTFMIGLASFMANAQTQAPNVDFEDWETIVPDLGGTYEEPLDWGSSNECTPLTFQFAVTKSNDAHTGNYSVRMETFSAFGNIKVNGMITTAQMICLAAGGGQEGGIAFTDAIPDSMIGWYKCVPMSNDSAYSQIMFLANNDQDTVSITRVDFTETVGTWTKFSTALNPANVGQSPEKLSLLFSSSWGDGSLGQAEVGSILFIDDVEFIYNEVGIDDQPNHSNWSVYPNPVEGELFVNVANGQKADLEILDVTGKRVRSLEISQENNRIDLSQLVTGVYLYQIRSLDDQVLKTGKLLVNP